MRRFHGSFSGHEPNHLFINRGRGRSFLEAGSVFGLAQRTDGRATATVDLDGDGQLDLAVQSLQDLKVFRNRLSNSNGYVQLSLFDRRGQPAIGAEVTVVTELGTVIDRVRLTAGFHTQVTPRLHLGLSVAQQIKSVSVRWPSGRSSQVSGVRPNGHFILRESARKATESPRPKWSADALPQARKRIDWRQPVQTLDGQSVPLLTGEGATILNLWAPWCAACKTEGPVLEGIHQQRPSGARVIGLVVEPKGMDSVRAFVAKASLTYPQRLAPRALVEALFGDSGGEIRLPTTLIFDQGGRLVRRFSRVVEAHEITKIVSALSVDSTATDHLRQAEIESDVKDHTEAFNQLLLAEKRAPDRADIVRQIDTTARSSGNSMAALRALTRLTELEPEDPKAWQNLAELALSLKGAQPALEAIKPAPPLPEIIIERARLHRRLQERQKAIGLLRATIKKHPKNQALKDALKQHLQTP